MDIKQELEYDEDGNPIFSPKEKWISPEQIAKMYLLSEEEVKKIKEIRDKSTNNH